MRALLPLLAAAVLATGADAQGYRAAAEQSVPPGDLENTDWWWWWHFNKDAYLRLRERVFERQPSTGSNDFPLGIGERFFEKDPTKLSAYELRGRIVPALLAALEGDPQTEPGDGMINTCLFALAKIGPDGQLSDGDTFHEIIVDYLDHSAGSVREQATLALGILGDTDSVPTLTALLVDSREGQRLTDTTEVPIRVRAFAAYALGLVGARTEDPGMRREIISKLQGVLDGPSFAQRDVKVACMSAFGIVPIETAEWQPVRKRKQGERRPPPPNPIVSRQEQLRYLLHFLDDWRTNHDLVRAHVPTALARLLVGADPRMKDEVLPALLEILAKFSKEQKEVQQSAVIAVGEIADADDAGRDRDVHKALFRFVEKGDQNARRFALIALGRIAARRGDTDEPFEASESIIKFLLRHLGPLGESRMHAWSALGLGVMMRALAEQRLPIPERPLEAMRKALEECRTPLDIGGYAIALGLARDIQSLETLEEKLELFSIDAQKGLVGLAMGMVGHSDATDALVKELEDATFRGERMELVSIALAVLGRPERVSILFELLAEAGSQESQGPIVAAMGVTGDRRVIIPLVEVLEDADRYTESVRSTAAFGLGIVADKDKLPWRSRYSANVNYASNPPTLQGGGILDVL
jgi:HEAT repeat protein